MTVDKVTVGNVEIVSVTDGAMRGTPAYFFAGVTPDVYTPALGVVSRMPCRFRPPC